MVEKVWIITWILISSLLIYRLTVTEIACKIYNIKTENVSTEFVFQNYTLKIKPINRHKQIVNGDAWLTQPLKNISVDIQVFKFFNQFRPYLIKFDFNFCDIMSQKSALTFYVRHVVRILKDGTNVLHECPEQGHVFSRNLSFDPTLVKLPLPLGRYKVSAVISEGYPKKTIGEILIFADLYEKQ